MADDIQTSAAGPGQGGDVRYVQLDLSEGQLRQIAETSPSLATYLVLLRGFVRLDFSDPTLARLSESPVMISQHRASATLAHWLIDHRGELDEWRMDPGRRGFPAEPERLASDERQAVYAHVDLDAEKGRGQLTLRASHFLLDPDTKAPSVLDETVLVATMRLGSARPLQDEVRTALGDFAPGAFLPAEILSLLISD